MISKKELRQLILPLMMEQLLAVSVGLVDTLMVSTVGEVAVSGVALVDNINRLVVQVMAAFATGGIVVSSQFYGRKEKGNATKTCAQLETIMLLFAAIIVLLFLTFTYPILHGIFGKVEMDVMQAAMTYLRITALSYPFLGIYNAGAAIFRSVGNSKISMEISLVMNLINVGLNLFFVFGLRMGVSGVACATLISRIYAGTVMKYKLCTRQNPLKVENLGDYKPDGSFIGKILKIGIPSGIENGMFQIGKLVVVGMVATLGTDAIAANAIGYQIIDFPNIPGSAIGLAMVTVVGQCIGAGEKEQAVGNTKKMLKYAYMGDWCCKIILFLIAGPLVSLFSLSATGEEMAIQILKWFAIASLPIWPLSFTLPNALRGAGDAKYSMLVSIVSMWVCRIIVSYILVIHLHFGVLGVWIGMFIDWYVRGTFYLIRFLSRKWLLKKAI